MHNGRFYILSWLGCCLPPKSTGMWPRVVVAALFLVFIAPISPFTFRIGAPSSGCDSDSIANGLRFFAHLTRTKPAELAIVDSAHTYPVEYVADSVVANCSSAALVSSLQSLAQSCQFLVAGSGFAAEQSRAADNLQRILIHAAASAGTTSGLDLPYVYDITTPPALFTAPVLKAMLLSNLMHVALAWQPDGGGDPLAGAVCAGALAQLPGLQQLRPDMQLLNYTYSTTDASTPGFFRRLVDAALTAGAEALLGCGTPAATEGLAEAAAGQPLAAVFLVHGPAKTDFLQTVGGGSGLAYGLTAAQWSSAVQHGDSLFGSATTYGKQFAEWAGVPADADAAGASAAGLTLALALRTAFARCNISGDVVQQGDVTRLLFDPSALACKQPEWLGIITNSVGTAAGADAAQLQVFTTAFMARAAGGAAVSNAIGYGLVMRELLQHRVETFYGPVEFNAQRRNVAKPPLTMQLLPVAEESGARLQQGAALSLEVVLPLEAASALLVMPVPRQQQSKSGGGPLLAPGSIVGIVLAGLLLVVVLVTVVHVYLRQRRRHRNLFGQVRAPRVSRQTTLCITDIESSTTLWESLPADVMDAAMQVHDATIRSLATLHDGYESANEGDSFVLAFHDPVEAVRFAIKAQQQLLLANWPDALLRHEKAEVVFMTLVNDGAVLGSACQLSSWCAQVIHVVHSKAITAHAPVGGLGLGLGSLTGGLNLRAQSLRKSLMGMARSMQRRLASSGSPEQPHAGRMPASPSQGNMQRSIPFGEPAAAAIASIVASATATAVGTGTGMGMAGPAPLPSWIDGAAASMELLEAGSAWNDGAAAGRGDVADPTEAGGGLTAAPGSPKLTGRLQRGAFASGGNIPLAGLEPDMGCPPASRLSSGCGSSIHATYSGTGGLAPAAAAGAAIATPGSAAGGTQPRQRPKASRSHGNMLQLYARLGGGGAGAGGAGGRAGPASIIDGITRAAGFSPGPSPLSTPPPQHHFYNVGAKQRYNNNYIGTSGNKQHHLRSRIDSSAQSMALQPQQQQHSPSFYGFAPTTAADADAASALGRGRRAVGDTKLAMRSSTPGALDGADSSAAPVAAAAANSAAGQQFGAWSGWHPALVGSGRAASAFAVVGPCPSLPTFLTQGPLNAQGPVGTEDGSAAEADASVPAVSAASASAAAVGTSTTASRAALAVIAATGAGASRSSAAGTVENGGSVTEEVFFDGGAGGSVAKLQLPSWELNVVNQTASPLGCGAGAGVGGFGISTAAVAATAAPSVPDSSVVGPSWRETIPRFRASAAGADLSTLHSCTSSNQQARLAALGQLGLSPEDYASALATSVLSRSGAQGGLRNDVLGKLLMSMFRRARPSDQPRFMVQRGLRVRMGLHSGIDDPHAISTNKASGRTQYGGSFLTIAKRTSDAANGGQICLTDETYRQIPSRSLLHRAWVLQMGHHQLGDFHAFAEEEEDCEYQLYQVVGYDLAVRLALLLPLRTPACLISGALSAPVGGLAIAFMYVHALQSLMSWNSEVTMEAVELFHRVASYRCKDHDGYVSEGQEGLVLAVFCDPAQALLWALSTQQALVNQPWDPELLEHELAEEVSVLLPASELPAGKHAHPVGAAAGTPSPLPTQLLASQELMSSATARWYGTTPAEALGTGGGMGIGAAVADMYGMHEDDEVPPGMVRKVLMRGLRMRVGIDVGRLTESISPTSSVMVYRGKAMNRAARIGGLASASQILCSAAAWRDACASTAVNVSLCINAVSLGRHVLRNVSEPIEVFHCKLRLAEQPSGAPAATPPSAPGCPSGTGVASDMLLVPAYLALPTELTLAGGSAGSSPVGRRATHKSQRLRLRNSELLNLLPVQPTSMPLPSPSRLATATHQHQHQEQGLRLPASAQQQQPQQQPILDPTAQSRRQGKSPCQRHSSMHAQQPMTEPSAIAINTTSAPLPQTEAVGAVTAARSEYGGSAAAAGTSGAGDVTLAANVPHSIYGTVPYYGAPTSRLFVRTTLGYWDKNAASGDGSSLGDGDGVPAPSTADTAPLLIASTAVNLDDGNAVAAAAAVAAGEPPGTGAAAASASGTTVDGNRSAFLTSLVALQTATARGIGAVSGDHVADGAVNTGMVASLLGSTANAIVVTASADGNVQDTAAQAHSHPHSGRSRGSSNSGVRQAMPLRHVRHSGPNIFLRDFTGPSVRVGGGPGGSGTAIMVTSASGAADVGGSSGPAGVGGSSGPAVMAVAEGPSWRVGKTTSCSGPKGASSGSMGLREGLAAVAATLIGLGGGGSGSHHHHQSPPPVASVTSPSRQPLPPPLPATRAQSSRSQSGHPVEATAHRRSRRRSVLHTRAAAAVDTALSSSMGTMGRMHVNSTSANHSVRMGPLWDSSSQRQLSTPVLEVSVGPLVGNPMEGEVHPSRAPLHVRNQRRSAQGQLPGSTAPADGGGISNLSPLSPAARYMSGGFTAFADGMNCLIVDAVRTEALDCNLDLIGRHDGDADEHDAADAMAGAGDPRTLGLVSYSHLDTDFGSNFLSPRNLPSQCAQNQDRDNRDRDGERERERGLQFQLPNPNQNRGGGYFLDTLRMELSSAAAGAQMTSNMVTVVVPAFDDREAP
ncbi:hypothetical protein VaNZ11_013593 [Volvox africanus]|uniref:Guanylate cyclase domain-containing protein n=1 Tax=Volvox africanus TaxID=51714 RepID=A0ABQ5SIL4_9CHLO|nr:hypothetical protein VaNZ11_013593 [Volvox africanus]